ncbi:MAG TPA: MarR family transcriptional regulator [Jatrophihabitans sp.]|nr:MarR family transcriptional regulator [Jatrophihabitans sp.]
MAHERVDPDEAGLPELFWAVARRLRHASKQDLARWDISPSQSRALMVLARHDRLRLNELSEHLRIAPRSTTEVVDALEAKGLIERRPDARDRRATLATLTAAGQALVGELHRAQARATAALFEPLSAADRDRLAAILRSLA